MGGDFTFYMFLSFWDPDQDPQLFVPWKASSVPGQEGQVLAEADDDLMTSTARREP